MIAKIHTIIILFYFKIACKNIQNILNPKYSIQNPNPNTIRYPIVSNTFVNFSFIIYYFNRPAPLYAFLYLGSNIELIFTPSYLLAACTNIVSPK
jgi:hypothetical protein